MFDILKAIPKFYSRFHKYEDFPVDILTNEKVILEGKASTPDNYIEQGKNHPLLFYWRLLKGYPPQIIESAKDGSHLKLIMPDKEGIVEWQLKVYDTVTKSTALKKFKINVVKSL